MGASSRDRVKVAERRERVLAARAAGMTFEQIAKEVGHTSRHAAAVDLYRALEERGRDNLVGVTELAALELERLDYLERAAQTVMRKALTYDSGYDPNLALRAIDRLQRISISRRRMLGLDQQGDFADEAEAPGFVNEIAEQRAKRRRSQGW